MSNLYTISTYPYQNLIYKLELRNSSHCFHDYENRLLVSKVGTRVQSTLHNVDFTKCWHFIKIYWNREIGLHHIDWNGVHRGRPLARASVTVQYWFTLCYQRGYYGWYSIHCIVFISDFVAKYSFSKTIQLRTYSCEILSLLW